MNWNNTSVKKDDLYQTLATLQMKNDCETIKRLQPIVSTPIIALSMLPYYALFCEESLNVISDFTGQQLKVKNPEPFNVKDIRISLKMFCDKYGKAKKSIVYTDDLQDEIFKSKLRFSFTKFLNINYNLGVFFDEQRYVMGNTQYFYRVLQPKKKNGYEYSKEELISLGKELGTVINSISQGLSEVPLINDIAIFDVNFKLFFKDYNTNKKTFCKFYVNTKNKEATLFLLHLISNINFVIFALNRIMDKQNTYLFKVNYITYYYSIQSLTKFINQIKCNNITIDREVYNKLNDILAYENLLNSNVRSCLMHYEFKNNGNYLISDDYIDIYTPFYGLIETHFYGQDYETVFVKIFNNLTNISTQLDEILGLNKDNLKIL